MSLNIYIYLLTDCLPEYVMVVCNPFRNHGENNYLKILLEKRTSILTNYVLKYEYVPICLSYSDRKFIKYITANVKFN